MNIRVQRSKAFKKWYESLQEKEQRIVATRIDKFRFYGERVHVKSLDPKFKLHEFKWRSGLRVYFSYIQDRDGNLMLLLIGGNKNSQASDIALAKNILTKVLKIIMNKGTSNET